MRSTQNILVPQYAGKVSLDRADWVMAWPLSSATGILLIEFIPPLFITTGLGVPGVLIESVADITVSGSCINEGEASDWTADFAGEVEIVGFADAN